MASLLERGIHSFSKEDLLACSRGELSDPAIVSFLLPIC